MLDLEPIKARLAAAVPGPWRAHDHREMARLNEDPAEWIGYAWVGYGGDEDGRFQGVVADLDSRKDASKEWRERRQHDAAFIAAAPTDIAALVAEVERLRAVETTRS